MITVVSMSSWWEREKKKLVANHLDRKDIRESSRSLKHYTIGKVKDMTLMILETLFKEKQIFSVFFQIPSAVYVWTQEWYSFQMKRSHFDKMTYKTTSDSKVKTYSNWVDRGSKRQTRHRLRSTWSPTSTDVQISSFRRRREVHDKHYVNHRNVWGVEKIHILRAEFRRSQTRMSIFNKTLEWGKTEVMFTMIPFLHTGFSHETTSTKVLTNFTRSRHRGALSYVWSSNALRRKTISRWWRYRTSIAFID